MSASTNSHCHEGFLLQPRATGLTLIELLVVIAILAMIAGLFPLAMQRMIPGRRLVAAAQTLVIHLRDLQSQASFSGRSLNLTVDASGYFLQRAAGDKAVHVEVPRSIELILKEDERAQPTHTLTMRADGSSNGGVFEMHLDQRVAKITVSPLTGHVRLTR